MSGQIFVRINDDRLAAWLTSAPVEPMPMYSHAAFEKWMARSMVVTAPQRLLAAHWPIVPGAERR